MILRAAAETFADYGETGPAETPPRRNRPRVAPKPAPPKPPPPPRRRNRRAAETAPRRNRFAFEW